MLVCPHCRLIYQNPAFQVCGLHGLSLVRPDEDPLLGTSLDRYEILEMLGTGAMGRVYRARHAVLGRVVAIKVLFGDYACEENFRLRFEREAQAVGQIRHPNVVSVTDFGDVEGLPFLVMDFLEGRSLEHVIDEQAPLPLERAAHLIRQIASGLEEAHGRGFVHRDIKPSNVIVSGDGSDEVASILDFGLVSMIFTPVGDDRLTTEGQVLGTPMYMSPEQTADPEVTPSSDIYSAGVLLYEMLAGRPPFLFESRMQMMMAHVMEHPPPLPESGGLEKLAMKMLEKDPKCRPATAREVVEEIDRVIASGFAKPMPPPSQPKKPTKKRDTHPELLRFNTFPALLPPAEAMDKALPTIELSAPSGEVRRVWNAKAKSFAEELIPVLLIEADQDIAIEIERRLDQRLFRVHRASRLDAGFKILEHQTIKAIIIDHKLPDGDGLASLDRIKSKVDAPVVIISKVGDEWLAIDAIRRGADDFLTCSAEELPRLQRALRFAMERTKKPPISRISSKPPARPDSLTKRATIAKQRRGRAMALGFGAMVFGIGLLAGLFISRGDSHASNSSWVPRTLTSTVPSR